tara:strand:+ start:297 stop:1031 length:735 start_codon:yes stop_codon:yes gene_type:complete
MTNKVFFAQPWGGLGDNLQYTTLPKLFSEKGIDFFLSQSNTYRNSEIYDFCWAKNPYVKGTSNHVANIGACAPDNPKGVADNVVSAAEMRHGFSGFGRYPEIYYDAKTLSQYKDKTIVDLSAHTLLKNHVGEFYDADKLFSLVEEHIPSDSLFVSLKNVNNLSLSGGFSFEENELEVENIFDYANIINSAKSYFCLYSGGNSMAAAVKNKEQSDVEINCFLHGTVQEHKDREFFIFDNVNYIEV